MPCNNEVPLVRQALVPIFFLAVSLSEYAGRVGDGCGSSSSSQLRLSCVDGYRDSVDYVGSCLRLFSSLFRVFYPRCWDRLFLLPREAGVLEGRTNLCLVEELLPFTVQQPAVCSRDASFCEALLVKLFIWLLNVECDARYFNFLLWSYFSNWLLIWIALLVLSTSLSWVFFGAKETCLFSPHFEIRASLSLSSSMAASCSQGSYLMECVSSLASAFASGMGWIVTEEDIWQQMAQYASLRDTCFDVVVNVSVSHWKLLSFICRGGNFSVGPEVRCPLHMILTCLTNLDAILCQRLHYFVSKV